MQRRKHVAHVLGNQCHLLEDLLPKLKLWKSSLNLLIEALECCE